jgi:orotidine-5'-phosphate decarboxylase
MVRPLLLNYFFKDTIKQMTFLEKLDACVTRNNSLLCVGLDPDATKMPAGISTLEFNKAIIDATADLVCAFKPNSAFYEARGAEGITELKQTCDYLHEKYPNIPIILDYKRADIGSTNEKYATFAFDYLGVDAVTIQAYFGQDAVQPFLDYADKGIIIMCKNSNPGSGEFQDLEVNGKKLYLQVAENVATEWNANSNCLLVVGATFPEELADVRKVVGDDMVILMPGIGAQGGDVEAALKAGRNSHGRGLVVNSSRAILYAADARQAATEMRDEINKYRS